MDLACRLADWLHNVLITNVMLQAGTCLRNGVGRTGRQARWMPYQTEMGYHYNIVVRQP
jgi:hypothetical protein